MDTEIFRYSQRPTSFRKTLAIGENERLICYTGRLSLQKNVIPLARGLLEIAAMESIPFHFVIAGGGRRPRGAAFWNRTHARIRFSTMAAVREWTQSSSEESDSSPWAARSYGYCRAVSRVGSFREFESLSRPGLWHVSCGGALLGNAGDAHGLGRLASFSEPGSCWLVGVKIRDTGLEISAADLRDQVSACSGVPDSARREKKNKKAIARFGMDAVRKRIAQLHLDPPESPCAGFNWRLRKY